MTASVPKRVFPLESPLTARTGPYMNSEITVFFNMTRYSKSSGMWLALLLKSLLAFFLKAA